MDYPVAIHKDKGSSYGVTVPDIPGCFSAGDTMDEAMANAKEAIAFHLEGMAEDGVFAPAASPIETLMEEEDYLAAVWAVVSVDVSPFLGKTEKATVTLPKSLIRQIDEIVAGGGAKSRSAFLAESAVRAIAQ